MLTTKNETSQTWPTIATSREREDDRDDREQHRDEPRDDGAEDEQQHDQRRGQPEEELALLQILVREREEVVVGGELAGDRRLERPLVSLPDDVDHVLDPVLGVRPHPDRDHDRVLVGREQPRIPVVEVRTDLRRPPGRLDGRGELLDLQLGLAVGGDVLARRPDEHDLVHVVTGRRHVPEDRVVALLRLRVVRHRGIGRDRRREQQRDRGDREHEDRTPDRQHPLRMERRMASEAFGHAEHANPPPWGCAKTDVW